MTADVAVTFVRNKLIIKKMDMLQVAKELTRDALRRGSVDNVTALIIAFHGVGAPPSSSSATAATSAAMAVETLGRR